ncbi:hypothetical protein CAPTEDRAFT_216318 [Capitella teleta]|uniref:Fucolectin tachylectin-4 pentraxin-1 domain-containing protein n=1 Tax=Capitella teleta TaxID=283909 RepID=R7V5H0_CAPTE|nr:hypothetical protein CAPTEDRAFT_216318 [Capitella teleta]|eukprot:ELU14108.1 hypothetical protein CAPTEDRAFT_216318 [Capitella teleta]
MGTCSECKDGFPRLNNHPYRFKWGGPACQIGNVAYNKATDQSGVYGGLDSSRGVDGITGSSSSQSNCAHPDNDEGVAAWFYVDLESVHQIYNVTIYNTFNSGGSYRMVDFSIRVGNTSDVDEHAECAHYGREAVVEGGDVTLDCSARGRYVSFRREGGEAIDLVAICEFVVIGHPLTTAECPAGRTGTFCLDVCDAGSFGVGCSEECGHCKNDLCSAVDGRCSDGCEPGFLGDRCNEKLIVQTDITYTCNYSVKCLKSEGSSVLSSVIILDLTGTFAWLSGFSVELSIHCDVWCPENWRIDSQIENTDPIKLTELLLRRT